MGANQAHQPQAGPQKLGPDPQEGPHRWPNGLGPYYIINNFSGNVVAHSIRNLEALAREEGVLADGEVIA